MASNRISARERHKNIRSSLLKMNANYMETHMPVLYELTVAPVEIIRSTKDILIRGRQTIKRNGKLVGNLLGTTAKDTFASLKKEISTGKLYSDNSYESAFDSMNNEFGDIPEDYSGDSSNDTMMNGFRDTGNVIASSTEYIGKMIESNNNVTAVTNMKFHSENMKFFQNIQNIEKAQLDFSLNEVKSYIESSKEYYEQSLNILGEIKDNVNALSKIIIETNLSRFGSTKKDSEYILDKILSGQSGALKEYAKYIKSQGKNGLIGSSISMVKTMLPMILKQFSENPIETILSVLANNLGGEKISKRKEKLNEGANRVFGQFLLGANKLKSSKNTILNMIGNMLGVDLTSGTKINTGSYLTDKITVEVENKKAKAITEVIPQYLQAITAQITGIDKVYDYKQGKFIDREKRDEAVKRAHQEIYTDSGEHYDILNSAVAQLAKGMEASEADMLKADMITLLMFLQTSTDERFDPKKSYSYYQNMGLHLRGSDVNFKILAKLYSKLDPQIRGRFDTSILKSRNVVRQDIAEFQNHLNLSGAMSAFNGFYSDVRMMQAVGTVAVQAQQNIQTASSTESNPKEMTKLEKEYDKMKKAIDAYNKEKNPDKKYAIYKTIVAHGENIDKLASKKAETAFSAMSEPFKQYSPEENGRIKRPTQKFGESNEAYKKRVDEFDKKYAPKRKEGESEKSFKRRQEAYYNNKGSDIWAESENFVNDKLNQKSSIYRHIYGENGMVDSVLGRITESLDRLSGGEKVFGKNGIISDLFHGVRDDIKSNFNDMFNEFKTKPRKTEIGKTLFGDPDAKNERDKKGIFGDLGDLIKDNVLDPIKNVLNDSIKPFFKDLKEDISPYVDKFLTSAFDFFGGDYGETKKKFKDKGIGDRLNGAISTFFGGDGSEQPVSKPEEAHAPGGFVGFRKPSKPRMVRGDKGTSKYITIGEHGPETVIWPDGKKEVMGQTGKVNVVLPVGTQIIPNDSININQEEGKRSSITQSILKKSIDKDSGFDSVGGAMKTILGGAGKTIAAGAGGAISTMMGLGPIPGIIVSTMLTNKKKKKSKAKQETKDAKKAGKNIEQAQEDTGGLKSKIKNFLSKNKGGAVAGAIASTAMGLGPIPGIIAGTMLSNKKKKDKEEAKKAGKAVEKAQKESVWDKIKKGFKKAGGATVGAVASTMLGLGPLPGIIVGSLVANASIKNKQKKEEKEAATLDNKIKELSTRMKHFRKKNGETDEEFEKRMADSQSALDDLKKQRSEMKVPQKETTTPKIPGNKIGEIKISDEQLAEAIRNKPDGISISDYCKQIGVGKARYDRMALKIQSENPPTTETEKTESEEVHEDTNKESKPANKESKPKKRSAPLIPDDKVIELIKAKPDGMKVEEYCKNIHISVGRYKRLEAFINKNPDSPDLPKAANGKSKTDGGPYTVGEDGKEVVIPPKGSKIVKNKNRSIMTKIKSFYDATVKDEKDGKGRSVISKIRGLFSSGDPDDVKTVTDVAKNLDSLDDGSSSGGGGSAIEKTAAATSLGFLGALSGLFSGDGIKGVVSNLVKTGGKKLLNFGKGVVKNWGGDLFSAAQIGIGVKSIASGVNQATSVGHDKIDESLGSGKTGRGLNMTAAGAARLTSSVAKGVAGQGTKGLAGVITKFVQKLGAKTGEKALEKSAGKIGTEIVKKGGAKLAASSASIVAKVSNFVGWAIIIAQAAYDFGTGCADVRNIMGTDPGYDPPASLRITCGLAKALSGFLLGLLPVKWFAGILYSIIGSDADKEALKSSQESQKQGYADFIKQHPEAKEAGLTEEKYNEITNKSTWTKIKEGVGSWFGKKKSSLEDYTITDLSTTNNIVAMAGENLDDGKETKKEGSGIRISSGRGFLAKIFGKKNSIQSSLSSTETERLKKELDNNPELQKEFEKIRLNKTGAKVTRAFGFGRGTVPYYSQKDPKWKNNKYGYYDGKSDTIGEGGCGPATAAMMFEAITGEKITPDQMAELAYSAGFKKSGTNSAFFKFLGDRYGIQINESSELDRDTIKILESGTPVAMLGSSSNGLAPFGKGNHWVLATGMQSGRVKIYDPLNPSNNKTYSKSTLSKSIAKVMVPNIEAKIPLEKAKQTLVNKSVNVTNKSIGEAKTNIANTVAGRGEDDPVVAIANIANEMLKVLKNISDSVSNLNNEQTYNGRNSTDKRTTSYSSSSDSEAKSTKYNKAVMA